MTTARRVLRSVLALVVVVLVVWIAVRATRGRNELGVTSVVLVTIDTVRADRIGAYGGAPDVMPTIDRLAREGVRFERCLTTAPITLPAHASILSGTDPIAHGARVNGAFAFAPENPSLARVLKDRGFATGAFVSAFVLDERFGLDVGFDEYDDKFALEDGIYDPSPEERRGERTVDAALDFVERAGSQPFFVWVHLFDPHAPYEAKDPFASRFEDPYDAELSYVDHCIDELLSGLAARERLDDCLLSIVADHGEGLGDHGESTHTVFVYDTTMRVPWIMWSNGRLPAGRTVGPTVSVISVAPTILDLLDLEIPVEMYGKSSKPLIDGERVASRPVHFESLAPSYYYGFDPLSGIELDGRKLIVAPRPELYDPKTDPSEQENLFTAEPAVASRLKRELDAYERLHATNRSAPQELSASSLARMRELGYLAGGGARESTGRDPKDGIHIVERLQQAALRSRDDRAGAIDALERLIADDPSIAEAHELLGDMEAIEDPATAAASYARARELRPRNPELYVKEGTARIGMGEIERAELLLRSAIDIDATNVRARVQLGHLHLRRGTVDAAKRRFDEVLLDHPDVVGARLGRAECLLSLGNVRLADQDLRAAVEQEPNNLHALSRLVMTCVTLRNLEDAVQFRARALDLDDTMSWPAEIEREIAKFLD